MSGPLASHLYVGPAVSGVLADRVGSLDLSAVGAPLDSQKGVGLASPPPSVVESVVGGQHYFANGSPTNPGGDPFALATVFRFNSVTTTRDLFGLRGPSGQRAILRIQSDGRISLLATGTTTTTQPFLGGNFAEGAWHAVIAFVDPAAKASAWSTADTSENAVAVGAIDNVAEIVVGPGNNAGGNWQGDLHAVFYGDEAAKVGSDGANMLDRLWTRFLDMSGNKLSVYAGASLRSYKVGSDASGDLVNHFSGEPDPPQVAWGFRGVSLGQGKVLTTAGSVTNFLDHSEDLSQWAAGDTSLDANHGDAPDGFRSADLVTQTGADGEISRLVSSLDAETEYCFWVRGNSDGQGAKTGRLSVYEDDSGAIGDLIHSETIALENATRQRYIAFTTPAGVTAVHVASRPEDGASAGKAHFPQNQVNLGPVPLPYVRTSGASASSVATDARSADRINNERGEVDVTFVIDVLPLTGSVAYVFDSETANDRRAAWVDSAGALHYRVQNATGSTVATLNLGTVSVGDEHRIRAAWDSGAGILGDKTLWGRLDSETAQTSDSALTANAGKQNVFLGRGRADLTENLFGGVARARAYDRRNA